MILLLTSSDYYTYRLVGYGLCYYDLVEHDTTLIGLGILDGKDAITSVLRTPDLVNSIQHELTHNFGARHDRCTPGQLCTLKGNRHYWCDYCMAVIKDRY